MNKLRFEILNFISSNPGANYSIRQISEELKKGGIGAHYSLVHKELENLEKEKTIKFLSIGKSRIPRLTMSSGTLLRLRQLELEKINFLSLEEKETLDKIKAQYQGRYIESITLINYKKFRGLNYFELLITLNDTHDGAMGENENIKTAMKRQIEEKKSELEQRIEQMLKSNQEIEKKIDAKINPLILLEKNEFIPKLFSSELNAIREGFLEHLCFSGDEQFWESIGLGFIRYNEIPATEPMHTLTDEEIIYFLGNFGFKINTREKIMPSNKNPGIEYLISEILSGKEPRWFEGIPVIISKNLENEKRINFRELLFLARRKNKINQLGYLLEITKEILSKSEKNKKKAIEIGKALKLFEFFKSEKEEPLIEGIKTIGKQDEMAKKWNIRTNYSFEDFRNRMSEYNAE